jgi:hypothetical protein
MRLKPILFLCALVVLGMTRSTTPAATKPAECQECRVHVWWWSPEGGDGSAVHNVGEPFLTNPDPSIPTVRSFTFPDTNTVVTVFVERELELKNKKSQFLKLGLWTGETEGDRNSVRPGWVYAQSTYRKGEDFRFLRVTKTIQIKNLYYTFEFNCHKPNQKK